jgi:hypothetical protein
MKEAHSTKGEVILVPMESITKSLKKSKNDKNSLFVERSVGNYPCVSGEKRTHDLVT